MAGSVFTTAPPDDIEAWLEAHNIKYMGHCSASFCKWTIDDERELVLFTLRWGQVNVSYTGRL